MAARRAKPPKARKAKQRTKAKPKETTRTCKRPGCSRTFKVPSGPGGKPQLCPIHRPVQNRTRDVRRAAKRSPDYAAELADATGAQLPDGSMPITGTAVAPLRLAAAIGLTRGDVDRAAALA